MAISIPIWAVGYSETDGCGTSWQVEQDGTVSIIQDGIVTQSRVGSATVNGDGTLSLSCPGCNRPITVQKPVDGS